MSRLLQIVCAGRAEHGHDKLAGKFEGDGIDSNIFMGCDVLHTLKLAHATLGVAQ